VAVLVRADFAAFTINYGVEGLLVLIKTDPAAELGIIDTVAWARWVVGFERRSKGFY
jgi:hypothetical protein